MAFTFECVIEADLAKEQTVYRGGSAGKALDMAALMVKLSRLFELTAVIKITRYKQLGGTIVLLRKTVFEEGEMKFTQEYFPLTDWHKDKLVKKVSGTVASVNSSMLN